MQEAGGQEDKQSEKQEDRHRRGLPQHPQGGQCEAQIPGLQGWQEGWDHLPEWQCPSASWTNKATDDLQAGPGSKGRPPDG